MSAIEREEVGGASVRKNVHVQDLIISLLLMHGKGGGGIIVNHYGIYLWKVTLKSEICTPLFKMIQDYVKKLVGGRAVWEGFWSVSSIIKFRDPLYL